MTSDFLDKLKQFWRQTPDSDDHNAGSAATERTLIENVENLVGLVAEDVMVPRADIVALDADAGTEAIFNLLRTTPHSRIPVYEGTLDTILGFVHIKDILKTIAHDNGSVAAIHLRELLRQAMIVSPSLPALDLLVEMRKSHRNLALVIDEYGGIDGLITMGDLVEAIVGEIDDEHKSHQQPRLMEKSDGSILVDARYPIDKFEEKYGEIFAENERNEVDTLGGLAMFLATRLPRRGEKLRHDSGVEIEIIDADERQLKRLRLRNMPKTDAEPDSSER